jgi:uncharacterized protein (DUF1697 family)
MTTYIALLRGINVGGNKMVAMAELRALLTTLGFQDVKTVLQSGNVVFRARTQASAKLEKLLEQEAAKALGVSCDFHVRTADEWRAMIAANPFADEARRDPGHVHVTCFKTPLDRAAVKKVQGEITGREVLQADGRHLYMVFPDGMGTSKATPLVARRLSGGTARNWNTVLKLASLVTSPSGDRP